MNSLIRKALLAANVVLGTLAFSAKAQISTVDTSTQSDGVSGLSKPALLTVPTSINNAEVGSTITLSASANAVSGLQWRWLLQGVRIPGATNATLTLTNAQPSDGGSFQVIAFNDFGSASATCSVLFNIPELPFTDDFASRGLLLGSAGIGRSSNVRANSETGEPTNLGYKAKRSVWARWIATDDGVVTMDTAGSKIDTVLGVYTGSTITNQSLVSRDEDSSGFGNSKLVFSARAGQEYNIVIAGHDFDQGELVFRWDITPTTIKLPSVTQPRSFAGTFGSPASMSVSYTGNDSPVSLQWLFEGRPIPDATNATYTIPQLRLAHVGVYQAVLWSGSFKMLSQEADLQVNTEGLQRVIASNRRVDADAAPIASWNTAGPVAALRRSITVVAGYSGSQIFATRFGKDPLEPDHCSVTGGSSYWLSYVPPISGVLFLDTAGSSYDTILGAYTDDGLGNGYASLISVACNDDVSPSVLTSRVSFNVTAGVTYYLVVDGKNGAYGTAYFNYQLTTPPTVSTLAAITINEDTSTGARAFTVGDAETPATNLVVTASSSNQTLVPTSGLVLGGSGASRTLNVIPAAHKFGTATITVTVTDAAGATASSSFTLTVNAVNDAPVAGTDTLYRALNANVTVPITTLLGNDTDADGDTRTLTGVATRSFLGATISKTSTSVTYTAKIGANGADYFTYTISDGKGGTATGRVNVYAQ